METIDHYIKIHKRPQQHQWQRQPKKSLFDEMDEILGHEHNITPVNLIRFSPSTGKSNLVLSLIDYDIHPNQERYLRML